MTTDMTADNWDIIPYEGLGSLRFGMTRAEVRSLLGKQFKSFHKGRLASTLTDAYSELGLHLEYDKDDRLRCIEAIASCPVSFNGVALLKRHLDEVLRDCASLGSVPRVDDGYFFDGAGFALYVLEDVVKAVTIYRKGYYEEPL
jgi:hypothetical protein